MFEELGGLDWKQNRNTLGHGRGQIIGSTWNRPELLETALKKWMPWVQRSEWSEVFPLFPLFMDHQNNLKNFEDPKAVVQCVPCCPVVSHVFACFCMFSHVSHGAPEFQLFGSKSGTWGTKRSSSLSKSERLPRRQLRQPRHPERRGNGRKKSAGSALGSMHQVRPSPGLYHLLLSMVSNYSFLFLVIFSQPLASGNEETRGIYFGWSEAHKFLALCIVQALRTWTLSKIFAPFVKSWERIFGTSGGLTWVASQFENKAKAKDTFLLE